MELAIYESLKAAWNGYIPIGGVLVYNNQLIFQGHNGSRLQHIELLIGDYIFNQKPNRQQIDYVLYLTQEPCIMCWFAIHNMPIKRLYFGSFNLRYGGYSQKITWPGQRKIEVYGGIREEFTTDILQSFFKGKR